MPRLTFYITLILLTIFYPCLVLATNFSSADFQVQNPVIDVGGTTGATSTSFKNTSALGQIAIATSSSASFQLKGGFLYFSAAAAAAAAAAAPSPAGGSNFSLYLESLAQAVVKLPVVKALKPCNLVFDLDCDGKVDLTDLSIFLASTPLTPTTRTTFNKNLSMLFYEWTNPISFFSRQLSGLLSLPNQSQFKIPSFFNNEKIAAISFPKTLPETATGLTKIVIKSTEAPKFIRTAIDFIAGIFRKVINFFYYSR